MIAGNRRPAKAPTEYSDRAWLRQGNGCRPPAHCRCENDRTARGRPQWSYGTVAPKSVAARLNKVPACFQNARTCPEAAVKPAATDHLLRGMRSTSVA